MSANFALVYFTDENTFGLGSYSTAPAAPTSCARGTSSRKCRSGRPTGTGRPPSLLAG